MLMLVAQSPTTGGGSFQFTYVNQAGVTKTSPVNYLSTTGAGMGALLTTQPASNGGAGRFLLLASGDTGVRQIIDFTTLVSNGGLGALVLVDPITDITLSEVSVPTEVSYPNRHAELPQVSDGAYLGFICNTAGSLAATNLTGRINYVWN